MIILALDQSSKETGYSLFETEDKSLIDFGLISLDSSDLAERLFLLRENVKFLIEKYNVKKVFLEDIQFQKIANGVTTYKILAEVIGVLTELFHEMKIPFRLVIASVWKSGLNIKGTNRQTQKANAKKYVEENFDLKEKSLTQDMADSICIGAYSLRELL